MGWQQELASWNPFYSSGHQVDKVPSNGDRAPSTGELTFPRSDGKPAVLTFLRHCGCPFAEKTFRQLRDLAANDAFVAYVAISHSDEPSTQAWLDEIGGKGNVQVIVDADTKIYSTWGLGASSFWHVLNPGSMSTALGMGKKEGISVRPTSSGSRWQTAGSFAVDAQGKVVWGRASLAADDIPSLEEGVEAVKK